MTTRGTKKFKYETQKREWGHAIQYRRDKQEELARAIASEAEAAQRTAEALEAMIRK